MRFIDKENNKQIARWEDGYNRKAYYIHGTTSDNKRWETFPLTVREINRIAFSPEKEEIQDMTNSNFQSKYCDFGYQWGKSLSMFEEGNNNFFNSVEDRKKASEDLIDYIIKKTPTYIDELVLIGHSHGGNVAIQAADKILSSMPQIKHLYILTIATPANNLLNVEINKKFIISKRGINDLCSWFGYLYRNDWDKKPENPENWEHKSKISHTALWNEQDWVDGAAYFLDSCIMSYSFMTFNHHYFDNNITKNVKFNICQDEEILSRYQLSMLSMSEWLNKLDYLGSCLFWYHIQYGCRFGSGFGRISIPEIKKYKAYLTPSLHKTSPMQVRDAIPQENRIPEMEKPIIELQRPDYEFQTLFCSETDFDRFCNEITTCISFGNKKADTFCQISNLSENEIQNIIINCGLYRKDVNYPELNYIEEIRQSLMQSNEYSLLYYRIKALKSADIRSHGLF